MGKELLPCPFCGSEKVELSYKGNAYTKTRSVTIKCKNCAVKRTIGAIRYDLEWCERKAIEAWNQRLPSHNSDYAKLSKRLQSGRDYLMAVSPEEISVEKCLIAFGWDSNGFE